MLSIKFKTMPTFKVSENEEQFDDVSTVLKDYFKHQTPKF